jgi:hypothetical protein
MRRFLFGRDAAVCPRKPSCGVYSLIKAGRLSASPITGLQITWSIARPINRSLNVAARLFLDTIFQVVHELVEKGGWPLAEIESNGAMQSRIVREATKDIQETCASVVQSREIIFSRARRTYKSQHTRQIAQTENERRPANSRFFSRLLTTWCASRQSAAAREIVKIANNC